MLTRRRRTNYIKYSCNFGNRRGIAFQNGNSQVYVFVANAPKCMCFRHSRRCKPHSSRRSESFWLHNIRQPDLPDICIASNNKLKVSGTINFPLRTDKLGAHVKLSVISKVVIPALLGITCIGRFIMSLNQAEMKIVLYHSPPVPILMEREAKSVADNDESSSYQVVTGGSALFVKRTKYVAKYNTVA